MAEAKSLLKNDTKKAKTVDTNENTEEKVKAVKKQPKVNPFKHKNIIIDGMVFEPGDELP